MGNCLRSKCFVLHLFALYEMHKITESFRKVVAFVVYDYLHRYTQVDSVLHYVFVSSVRTPPHPPSLLNSYISDTTGRPRLFAVIYAVFNFSSHILVLFPQS